jgi:hypothetical protein
MRNQRQPCFPAISGTIETLDPGPSIGIDSRPFQYLEHQFVVALKVLAFLWHLVTSRSFIVEEQFVVFAQELRA